MALVNTITFFFWEIFDTILKSLPFFAEIKKRKFKIANLILSVFVKLLNILNKSDLATWTCEPHKLVQQTTKASAN